MPRMPQEVSRLKPSALSAAGSTTLVIGVTVNALTQASESSRYSSIMHASNASSQDQCNTSNLDDDLKSPISLVHEAALKRELSVSFEVIRETGPPHMRTFVTKCIVGDFVTEGEGNGKKVRWISLYQCLPTETDA